MADADFQTSPKKRNRGYIEGYRPQEKTRALISTIEAVLEEYREYWPLTVRQVFYRLVGVHDYPKTESDYKKLCHHLANARRAKLIPFRAIRDDGVTSMTVGHFDDEDDFHRTVRRMAEGYTRNKLAGQPRHIEVWCEAAGMLPQLANAAEAYSVKVYSSSGFDSLTAKKKLADRICGSARKPSSCIWATTTQAGSRSSRAWRKTWRHSSRPIGGCSVPP